MTYQTPTYRTPLETSPAPVSIAARAHNATKRYGEGSTEVLALDGIDIAFAHGHFSAIMGPSGSGKSTLMHCLAGLDQLSSGTVYIGDTELTALNEQQLTRLRRDEVGFIFQAFNLVPTLSAYENITLPAELAGAKLDTSWVDHVIATVGLGDRIDHRPNELSGGQQQRVAVARALASRPGIIFADEPTGNLDSTTGTAILEFMQQAVTELGQTIVMVTHDATAASFANRVVFLSDGRVAGELADPTSDVIHDTIRSIGRTAGR